MRFMATERLVLGFGRITSEHVRFVRGERICQRCSGVCSVVGNEGEQQKSEDEVHGRRWKEEKEIILEKNDFFDFLNALWCPISISLFILLHYMWIYRCPKSQEIN